MNSAFKIVIATRDSASWIGAVLEWYQYHDLAPLFIVDARTKDATRELIRQHGFDFKEFLPRGDFPEAGMLEFGAQLSDVDWILRIDDDELPNENLLRWVKEVGVKSKNQCWFISRRELFFNEGRVLYSRSMGKYPLARHPDKLHPMARLYHRDRVKYLEKIHTTGFEDFLLYDFAPEENYLIHFNCLLHSFQKRVRKLESYDAINPELSWSLADEYLPELFSLDFHQASDTGLAEFASIFKKFHQHEDEVSITEQKRDFILMQVKNRSHSLLKERYEYELAEGKNLKHFSADDIFWIEFVPQSLRRVLAKMLNSLISKKYKVYSNAVWNYCELYSSSETKKLL